MNVTIKIFLMMLTVLISELALAHTGHGTSGFSAGFMHPLSGLDHLLAMVAVGIWASQWRGLRAFILPVTFMLSLVVGALAGMSFSTQSLIEVGIATSVLALGLVLTLAIRLPVIISITTVSVFGMLHGYAHGAELPIAAAPINYIIGFLLTTLFLHIAGVSIGLVANRFTTTSHRWIGGMIAVSGLYLLIA